MAHTPKKLSSNMIKFVPYHALPSTVSYTKNVKYFDDKKICHTLPVGTALQKGIGGITKCGEGKYRCLPTNTPFLKKNANVSLFMSAVAHIKSGNTWEDFLKACDNAKKKEPSDPRAWIDRYLGLIKNPEIRKDPDHQSNKMFDYIQIQVCLTDITPDHKKTVTEHFDEILDVVLKRIESNSYYKKFNFPVSDLLVTRAIITPQKVLELTLEPKKSRKQ